MVKSAAALTALAVLALGASSALGAGPGAPEGPVACSAVSGGQSAARPWRVDLWVQCNYQVSEIGAKSGNRKLRWVGATPEVFGGAPSDEMSCLMKEGAPVCQGRLKPFARVHIRLNVNEAACNRPVMRMSVDAFGGEACEPGQTCSEVGFSSRTPVAFGGTHKQCVGG